MKLATTEDEDTEINKNEIDNIKPKNQLKKEKNKSMNQKK